MHYTVNQNYTCRVGQIITNEYIILSTKLLADINRELNKRSRPTHAVMHAIIVIAIWGNRLGRSCEYVTCARVNQSVRLYSIILLVI